MPWIEEVEGLTCFLFLEVTIKGGRVEELGMLDKLIRVGVGTSIGFFV